jgi:hypothetical protein
MKKVYENKRPPLVRGLLATIEKRKTSTLWFIVTAVGAILPALLVLVSGYTLVWRDTSKCVEPIRPLIVEALRNFQLPLWNPHEALGIPLFAQMMYSVLHPASVLGAFLFPNAGMDIFILIYIMLAAAGNFILARILGASLGAAAVAGLGYGLSGYVLGMSNNISYLCPAATAPWCIAAIRIAGEGRRFGIIAATGACASLYFSGDPQWTIIAFLVGIALAIEAGGMRGLKKAALGIAVGTVIAAVQLTSMMMLLPETSRGIELDYLDRIQWALSPWRIVEFIAPGFFGSPNLGLTKWPVFMWLGGLARPGLEMPYVPSVHVGASILVLAAAGLLHSRVTRLFGIASLILLWLALGVNAGAEQLTHFIPIWGKFRFAEKMVGPLTLCLSILAAFGTERLSSRPSKIWAICTGITGLVFMLLVLSLVNWQSFDTFFTVTIAQEAAPHVRQNLTLGLVHAGAALTALAGLLASAWHWPRMRNYFTMSAAGLVFIQLSFSAPLALHAGTRDICDRFPLSQIINRNEPTRIATPLEEGYHYPFGLDQFDAQTGAHSHMGAPSYNVPSRIDQINTYTGLRPWRLDSVFKTLAAEFGPQSMIALRRYAITDTIIRNPHSADDIKLVRDYSWGGMKVFENPEWDFTVWKVPHRQWATFAEKVMLVSGEKEALKALTHIVEYEESTVVLENATPPESLGTGQVLTIERKSDYLRIEAVSNDNGILVVNDSYWPGWKARVDGKEVPIWRADYLVRAVPWPSGRHVLEMKYDPIEVKIGMLVSIAGVVAFFGLFIMEWRRGRKTAK